MTYFDDHYRRIPKAATSVERMPDGRLKFLPCPPEHVYVARESNHARHEQEPTPDLFAALEQQGYRFPQEEGRP